MQSHSFCTDCRAEFIRRTLGDFDAGDLDTATTPMASSPRKRIERKPVV